MNVLLPKYEPPPEYIPASLVFQEYITFIYIIYNDFCIKKKRKGHASYDNRLTLFMPRLIYIKKSCLEESVSFNFVT